MTRQTNSSIAYSQNQLMLLAERFLASFYKLVRAVGIHQDNNQLVIDCVKNFVDAVIKGCIDEDYLEIEISRGRFFLQNEKFTYRRETANIIDEMLNYFQDRKLGGLRFNETLKDVSLKQVLAFVHLLNDAGRHEDHLAELILQLKGDAFPWVKIIGGPEEEDEESELERKEVARKTYSHALASIKQVSDKLASRRWSGIRRLKRITQNMVDLLEEDESLLLSMSTFREFDDYTYTHSVNVAILSMCLGRYIGLSRISLMKLGICGLVHDLGKVDVPPEILNKPGKLNEREFKVMKSHPLNSVRRLIKMWTSRDLKVKIMLPAFEHHLKYDLSGYPRIHRRKPISLFGRILTIADVFDAITSPRIYRSTTMSPDSALALMEDEAGKAFDPILLKAFFAVIGVYPVGTLLQMDTGEIGLVMDAGRESPRDGRDGQRMVLLEADEKGGYKKGEVVNLTEIDPHTGSLRRNIAKSLHPSFYGIQPMEFLI